MVQSKFREWIAPDGLTKIRGWAQQGLVDEQIAHNMGINVSTLYTWKKKYKEIDEALKKGKEVIDLEVTNKLLERAIGESRTVVHTARVVDVKNDVLLARRLKWIQEHKSLKEYEEYTKAELEQAAILLVPTREAVEQTVVTTEALPDTTAQIFWLKNRRPDLWRDKQYQELSGQVNSEVETSRKIDKMSDDQIRELLRGDQVNGDK